MAMMALALLLPSVVSALRDTHGLESRSLWQHCRSAKLDGQIISLEGDLGGDLALHDCEVDLNNPFQKDSLGRMCEETCKVWVSGERKSVKVHRQSGKGVLKFEVEEGLEDICKDTCCTAKCSGDTYHLKGDLEGQLQFQDCQVKPSNASKCEETCKVVHFGESRTIKVQRQGGPGPGQGCEVVEGLEDISSCYMAKCNGATYELYGDLGGQLQFQDCQVKPSNASKCEETCKVVVSGESKTVKVVRKSGSRSCLLAEGLEDVCQDACCKAKCSGKSYELKAKWQGKYQFQDCRLGGEIYLDSDSGLGCQETCTVPHDHKEVQVVRSSATGPRKCEMMERDLQEIAMDFVEQLEKQALRLPSGQYHKLPIMTEWKIVRFLKAVLEEVLSPEMAAAGGHGYSRQLSKETQNVAIIGDLHGQLFNLIAFLLAIKKQYHGKGFSTLPGSYLLFCDPRMTYLFMGDYVDRGEMGVELLMLLLAYKASCPQSLILLQGNHETSSLWRSYGFAEELHYKFNSRIEEHLVSSVTATLPFVAVLPGRWMAMHGGISPSFVEVCSGQAGRFESCLDDSIGQTLTWPDPHDGNGFQFSHRDGFHGTIRDFGMDIVADFLKSNGLRTMFRGHEQVEGGYNVRKKNMIERKGYVVATVFSAADYGGLFCRDGRLPPFYTDMFKIPGEGNEGAIAFFDVPGNVLTFHHMKPRETRSLASKFVGAKWCRGGFSLSESSETSLESFIQENHKRLDLGNSSCSLDEAEANVFEEEIRKILTSSSDPEFEARKLVDLEGEALTNRAEERSFICKSMMKDRLTLRVYKELQGPDADVLKQDIQTRSNELLNESTDVEA